VLKIMIIPNSCGFVGFFQAFSCFLLQGMATSLFLNTKSIRVKIGDKYIKEKWKEYSLIFSRTKSKLYIHLPYNKDV